jgi:endonuclease YncB( thermonuclease family)
MVLNRQEGHLREISAHCRLPGANIKLTSTNKVGPIFGFLIMARRQRGSAFSRLISIGLTLGCFALLAFLIARLDGANSEKLSGKPYVIDGDSLELNGQRLRLMGIDAPELRQQCTDDTINWPCGEQSRAMLRRRIGDQPVACTTWGKDRYQRLLAICAAGGEEINAWLVEAGWAVDYGGYASEEGRARRNRAGIWRGNFENPGEWRKAHRSQASAVPHTMPSWLMKFWVWLRAEPGMGESEQ